MGKSGIKKWDWKSAKTLKSGSVARKCFGNIAGLKSRVDIGWFAAFCGPDSWTAESRRPQPWQCHCFDVSNVFTLLFGDLLSRSRREPASCKICHFKLADATTPNVSTGIIFTSRVSSFYWSALVAHPSNQGSLSWSTTFGDSFRKDHGNSVLALASLAWYFWCS